MKRWVEKCIFVLPVFGRRRKNELAASTGYVVRLFSSPTRQPTNKMTAKPKSALEMTYERVVIKKKLEIELPTLRATEAKKGQLCRVHV